MWYRKHSRNRVDKLLSGTGTFIFTPFSNFVRPSYILKWLENTMKLRRHRYLQSVCRSFNEKSLKDYSTFFYIDVWREKSLKNHKIYMPNKKHIHHWKKKNSWRQTIIREATFVKQSIWKSQIKSKWKLQAIIQNIRQNRG